MPLQATIQLKIDPLGLITRTILRLTLSMNLLPSGNEDINALE
jgi:hypothetical protein